MSKRHERKRKPCPSHEWEAVEGYRFQRCGLCGKTRVPRDDIRARCRQIDRMSNRKFAAYVRSKSSIDSARRLKAQTLPSYDR